MNRVFVIADTHFGHKKILDFESAARPYVTIQDHDDDLVDRWNSVVKPKDTVWHLGDVLFGRDSFSTLPHLNGVKKLVLGNHDTYPSRLYLEYFNQIVSSVEIKNCLLTHIPIHPSQFRRYRLNIHGHLHSGALDDERYVNVSAERIKFTPVLLNSLIFSPSVL